MQIGRAKGGFSLRKSKHSRLEKHTSMIAKRMSNPKTTAVEVVLFSRHLGGY